MKDAKKVKSSLATAWKDAPDNGCNIIEGVFQFKIDSAKYKESEKSVGIKTTLKVIGGNEEYVGEVIQQYDTLNTPQNMSYFKQKLVKLGVNIPEDFSDIEDGTTCSEMEGLAFEGTVKIKDGFTNIYVNKLIDADDEESEEETEEAEEEVEEEDEVEEEIEEEEVEEEEASFPPEEESEEEEASFPEPEEVDSMKLVDINKQLKSLEIDIRSITQNKTVLKTISNYIYVKGFKPEPMAVKVTMAAFKIKMSKDPVANRKALQAHIDKLVG